MATVVLFHHVQGLTPGVAALAESLRSAGHAVHAPDLFDGRTFSSIDEGFAYVQSQGFEAIGAKADAAADAAGDAVYVGISMGVVQAQRLVQTREGALGGVFLEGFVPPSEFGAWPADVPAQVHGADHDPFFADEGDIDAAREFTSSVADAELFVYEGDQHLFTDSSLPAFDADATALVVERVLELLARIDAARVDAADAPSA